VAVFIKKPVQKRSLLEKLMKKQIPENLIIEINNLLAERPIMEASPADIKVICQRYDAVTLAKSQRRLLGYYHLYLQECLEDKKLTDQEIAELARLKLLLGLSDRMIKEIHSAVVTRLYGKEVSSSLNDGTIDNDEQAFLDKLSENLLLSKERTDEILASQATKKIGDKLEEIMEDGRITPEEESEFQILIQNLGLKPEVSTQTQETYERYKIYWQLENEPLPKVTTDIKLRDNESACFTVACKWYESHNTTRIKNFNTLSGQIKLPGKESWHTGYPGEVEDPSENWELVDTGKMILTNLHLVFIGQDGRKSITVADITNFVPYSDGMRLERNKAASTILEMPKQADFMAVLLNRVISEQ
jgi:Chloroplast envelope transporter